MTQASAANLDFYLSQQRGSGASMPENVFRDLSNKFVSHGGGGGFDPAAGGFGTSTIRGQESQVRPGMAGNAQEHMETSRSPLGIPGGHFLQVTPNTPIGQGAGDAGNLPTLVSQAAIPRVRTLPTGAEWPAGSVVNNNFSNLNGLKNRAYGVNYG